jgi:predicted kinase
VMVEDLLLPPGRYGRPSKIVVILRGLPGSGKSHLARSIKVRFQLLLLFRLNFKI